ncbi:MAG: hypothetical protein RLY31_3261 [Bacteroidota bacterium]
MKRTAVIGAGIGGLATAIRLACLGHSVTVFEANAYPGGKLTAFSKDGFRFDAGPSLFTMPQYVTELFDMAGERAADHFTFRSLPVSCHYFWEDGTRFQASTDRAVFAREAASAFGTAEALTTAYLQRSERKYRLAGRIFLEYSLHRLRTWFQPGVLKALAFLPFFDLFRSMHQVNRNWFGDPRLTQLFDRYATYNGSDPYQAPGMLTIIPHFEHGIGTFYPEGGMHRITEALYGLALRKGVAFRFGETVSAIETKAGTATGIRTAGRTEPFDRVVSNMDVYYTYHRLLEGIRRPERILRQPKSTSALIFYWGVDRVFPELHLHNIFFSADYETEFRTLAAGAVSEDPTVYVNITSKLTPSDAPAGAENWFVMVNTPCADTQGTSEAWVSRIREQVLAKLSRRLGVELGALVRTEAILDPSEIERRTSSHRGALYGYSSNNMMAAFLRHPNFSSRVKNLYFVGGSVHPGGGIPLCLLSAKITAKEIGPA